MAHRLSWGEAPDVIVWSAASTIGRARHRRAGSVQRGPIDRVCLSWDGDDKPIRTDTCEKWELLSLPRFNVPRNHAKERVRFKGRNRTELRVNQWTTHSQLGPQMLRFIFNLAGRDRDMRRRFDFANLAQIERIATRGCFGVNRDKIGSNRGKRGPPDNESAAIADGSDSRESPRAAPPERGGLHARAQQAPWHRGTLDLMTRGACREGCLKGL